MSDVNKEIALKVTADTGQAQKAFANAQQELEETRKKLVDLALAGKQSSEEFRTLEARAGAIQDAIGDVNARVTALANDTPKLQLFGEAVRGVAAGFSIAQGAAALFGDENEDLQKAILQVQGSMALLNGVQEVANLLNKDSALRVQATALAQRILQAETIKSTLALRGWSAALAATGIGLFIVALGLLTAAFVSSTDASEDMTESLERQKKAQEELKKQIELTIQSRQLEIELLQMAGANEKEVALLRLQLIAEQIAAQQKAIDTELKNIELLDGTRNKSLIETRKRFLLEKENRLKELQLEMGEQIKIIEQFDKNVTDSRVQSSKLRLEALKAVQVSATAENIKAAQDEVNAIIAINQQGFNARLQQLDAQAVKEAEYRANRLADEEALQMGIQNLAKGSFQAIADLSAFFAGQDEERQKKAFEIQKAAGIANTLIDTYAAAQSAFKSASAIPVIGSVAGPIAAAAAVAAGLARVAQIRNTQFQSAAGSAAPQAIRPAGIPNTPTGAPQVFNPNTSTPNLPTNPQPSAANPQPLRAYVVDRDIEQGMARRNRLREFAGI